MTAPRRARLLVSGAAAASVVTAVLLALLTAALVAGWGGGPAVAYGSAAFGAAGLAVGLLVLARAGAVARTDAARGRALCNRCCLWALFAVLPVFIVGGVAGYMTRAAAPIWGSTMAGLLLIALVGLAARQRVVLQVYGHLLPDSEDRTRKAVDDAWRGSDEPSAATRTAQGRPE